MTVPQSPPREDEPDELYEMAPAEEDASTTFSKMRSAAAAAPPLAAAQPAPSAAPLPYQPGPTQRERERMSSSTLMDMKRDVYLPVVLLALGFILYVGYYAFRYELGPTGVAMTGLGLGFLTAFKAGVLIGFALLVAGPLGVSFGGVWTAVLKLAAIAVFTDGVTTWVDAGVDRISGGTGGGGMFGFGLISFPVALGMYWLLLTYLFSMDAGDSWFVVMLLAVFDYIVRTVLLLLVLRLVLGLSGISPAAVPVPAFGGAAPTSVNPMVERVNELKQLNLLQEARQYIAGGRQMALSKPTEAWYEAGCKNVWFEVSRDINGRLTPEGVIVELPKDKAKRDQCYEILKAYYDEHNLPYDDEELVDDGDPYLIVPIN